MVVNPQYTRCSGNGRTMNNNSNSGLPRERGGKLCSTKPPEPPVPFLPPPAVVKMMSVLTCHLAISLQEATTKIVSESSSPEKKIKF